MIMQDYRYPVTVIVKLTNNCNLSCSYCYYINNPIERQKQFLDWDLVEKLMTELAANQKMIDMIWHGGEPLLVGIPYFKKVLVLQRSLEKSTGTKFCNKVQTNGTLLTVDWIEFFMNENIGIGISLDGPEWVHDVNRKYRNGKSSFNSIMRSIVMLKEMNAKFSILSVVTNISSAYGKDIFKFFVENGIKSFDFLPCIEYSKDGSLLPYSIEKGEFGKFMIDVFDSWFELDDPTIKIRYLQEVIKGLVEGKVHLCKFNRSCANFMTLDQNGIFWGCDNLIGIERFMYGDLNNVSMDYILSSAKRTNFINSINAAKERMPDM